MSKKIPKQNKNEELTITTKKIRNLAIWIIVAFTGIISFVKETYDVPIWTEDGDVSSWVAVLISIGFGIFIALAVVLYSNNSQKRVSEIVRKQNEEQEDRKKFSYEILEKQIDVLIYYTERPKKLFEFWEKETDPQKKKNFYKSIGSYATRAGPVSDSLFGELIAPFRLFDTNLLKELLYLKNLCFISADYFDYEEGITPLMDHYSEIRQKCDQIKEMIKSKKPLTESLKQTNSNSKIKSKKAILEEYEKDYLKRLK